MAKLILVGGVWIDPDAVRRVDPVYNGQARVHIDCGDALWIDVNLEHFERRRDGLIDAINEART